MSSAPDQIPSSESDTFARFTSCAIEVLGGDPLRITREANFVEDLDADSLDLVELIMALEEEFDVEIPEEDLEHVFTIGGAYDVLVARL